MMNFVQKKKSKKHTFTLHDDYFNFAYEDKSGSGGIDMNYGDLPKKSSIQIEQQIAQAELLKKDEFELPGERLN